MDPRETIILTWKATVSPKTSYVGGVPALVSLIYYDPNGYLHTFNQTVILYIEGLARLKVIDVVVEPSQVPSNSSFSVSATLVNVGSDVAKHVEAYIVGDNIVLDSDSYVYLGDIDVGTQIPFTLYGYVEDYIGELNVSLVIKYSNVFNEEKTIIYPLVIEVVERVEEEGKQLFVISDMWKLIITIVVSFFLVVSVYLIYRLYKGSRAEMVGVTA
jgi:hypothetical protein